MRLQDLDLDKLLAEVYAQATSLSSHVHGEKHWLRVTKVGLELARQTPHCDPTIIFLFGLLHDTQRLREGRDPEHGERASHFVQRLNNHVFSLSDDQLKMLTHACDGHDKGKVSDNPTIGICWDADRLNLWRVMRIPSGRFLSTSAAKTWEMCWQALSIQLNNQWCGFYG